MIVTDFQGSTNKVTILPKYSTKQFTDGRMAIKAFIYREDDKTLSSVWLPVFTEWFAATRECPLCHTH